MDRFAEALATRFAPHHLAEIEQEVAPMKQPDGFQDLPCDLAAPPSSSRDVRNCENANCSCFNLDCGFVQTDNTVFLDAGWSSYSVSGGAQQYATLSLLKIYASDNWHFMYGNKWVGLWVRAMFDSSGIADSASRITFGGEVYAANNSPHTSTDMGGDGTFGSNAGRWQHAAYQKLIKSIDTVPNGSATWTSPSITLLTPTRVTCYDHFKDATTDATWGTYMFHGGIGNHTSGSPSNYCQ